MIARCYLELSARLKERLAWNEVRERPADSGEERNRLSPFAYQLPTAVHNFMVRVTEFSGQCSN